MTTHTNRRTLLKGLGATGLLLTTGVGSAAAKSRQRQGASAEPTIFEIADGAEDFEILVAALETTGLDDVLDGGGRQFTVFAPTDDAFEALLADLGITATDLLENPALPDILRYHVTNGRRYAPSVIRAPQIRMLNGEAITVDGLNLNGQAEIQVPDIEAANGVVHVIDGVLLP